MANSYGMFWDSRGGDRVYSAESMEEWLKPFFVTGVFNGELAVTATTGMTISVSPGYCNIDGKVRYFDTATTFTLETAGAMSSRVDTVVIERNDGNREITLKVVTGTAGGGATPPVREGGIYQLVLAQIAVAAGATEITQSNITDTRTDSILCGYVCATVDEINFDEIVSQFTTWFNEYKEEITTDFSDLRDSEQTTFEAWFNNLVYILDGDVAGHLQNEIDELNQKIDGLLKPRLYVYADTGTTVTAVKGTTTITATEIDTGLFQCDLNDYGDWTVDGTADGSTAQTIISVDTVKEYIIHFIPDGSTITPTDDISIWLHCAGIFNKNYTTISEVLSDTTTLQTLISSQNANDYLVRSTSWVSNVCGNSTAMSYIGLNNYSANTLLADSTWCTGICNSTYFESVLNVKVPTMTSNTTPSGECFAYGTRTEAGYQNYYLFDGNENNNWSNGVDGGYCGYEYPSAKKNYMFVFKYIFYYSRASGMTDARLAKIQASNDGSNYTDLYVHTYTNPDGAPYGNVRTDTQIISAPNTYKYYRLWLEKPDLNSVDCQFDPTLLQFYGREDV